VSLTQPEFGERCRCLQCGALGEIEDWAPFHLDDLDDAVVCATCMLNGGERFDVERASVTPEELAVEVGGQAIEGRFNL